MSDKRLLRVLAGMFFCITGSIIAYIVAGLTVYFLLACAFIIIACSLVIGIADKLQRKTIKFNVMQVSEVDGHEVITVLGQVEAEDVDDAIEIADQTYPYDYVEEVRGA